MYQSNTCNMTYNEHWCLILSTFLAHTLTPLCIRTLHKLVQLIRNTNNRVQRNAFLPVLLIPMPPYQYQLKIHYHMLEYTKHRTQKHTHISHTFTLRVLTGSLSRDTVRGKMTSSLKTTGSSTGDWKNIKWNTSRGYMEHVHLVTQRMLGSIYLHIHIISNIFVGRNVQHFTSISPK